MDCGRNPFFPRAAFPRDQHGSGSRRHLLYQRENVTDRVGDPHQIPKNSPITQLPLQPLRFIQQALVTNGALEQRPQDA